MSHRFIDAHRLEYPVREMCAALGVSSSGYYARAARKPCARQLAAETVLAAIKAIHAEHPAYGSPRIHAQLLVQGHQASRGTIEKRMRDNDIFAITRRKFRVTTTDSLHDFPIADNLLDRNFRAFRPNEKWLADITYIPTGEGWLYLAAVMDLCTRKIVGWAMRDHMRTELTSSALMMAIQRQRPAKGLIHHSDRGSQYAAHDYRAALDKAGLIASMSRKGNCWDNAPMESFFHTIKTEELHHHTFKTKDEAKSIVFKYIEIYYNRNRIHSAIGYLTPEQMELKVA